MDVGISGDVKISAREKELVIHAVGSVPGSCSSNRIELMIIADGVDQLQLSSGDDRIEGLQIEIKSSQNSLLLESFS
jgi:hypothetical protein